MFSCEECHHIESSEDMLKVHYDFVHIGKESNSGQRFSNTSDLAHHQSPVHKEVKHPCKQCGHQFTSNGNLDRHISEVHKEAVHKRVKHPCG